MTGSDLVRRYSDGERDFRCERLEGVELYTVSFENCDFRLSAFHGSRWFNATFNDCDFTGATWDGSTHLHTRAARSVFDRCGFFHSTLFDFFATACSFAYATWHDADIRGSAFTFCDFEAARLSHTTFESVSLADCNFSRARVGQLIFTDCRIPSLIEGNYLQFDGGVTMDWITLCQNATAMRLQQFLLRSGLPEVFATYSVDCARSLDPAMLFSLMRSTFISYGGPDEVFASRLRDALVQNGVRTFLFADDAVPGQPLHSVMREGVANHDRIIVICSKDSLDRRGVQNEIELALKREARDGGASYVIPVILDDFIFSWKPERWEYAQELRDRVVADFRQARSHDEAFRRAVSQLMRALRR
jgi:hypothetical protein